MIQISYVIFSFIHIYDVYLDIDIDNISDVDIDNMYRCIQIYVLFPVRIAICTALYIYGTN